MHRNFFQNNKILFLNAASRASHQARIPHSIKRCLKIKLHMWLFKETNTAPQRPNMWSLNCQNLDFHILHPSRNKNFHTWKVFPAWNSLVLLQITGSCRRGKGWLHSGLDTSERNTMCHVSSVLVALFTLCIQAVSPHQHTTIYPWEVFN